MARVHLSYPEPVDMSETKPNLLFLLFVGMGKNILERHVREDHRKPEQIYGQRGKEGAILMIAPCTECRISLVEPKIAVENMCAPH